MKRIIICIVFLSMMGGKCFSQGDNPDHFYVPDELLETFVKGYQLANEGKWAEAFPYYKYVADKGNVAYTQSDVAVCYQNGEGVPVDFKKSFEYMYKAATNSKPWGGAFYGLGEYYRLGIGTPKNLEEAFKWYYKGTGIENIPFVIWSEDDINKCEFKVAEAYLLGEGIKQDGNQGVYWLKKADEDGNPNASFLLAMLYLHGDIISKDEIEGVKWLRKTAEKGDAEAQYLMGKAYRDGIGNLPKDKSKAIEWFSKAVVQGYTKALDEIRNLEK